MFTHGSCLLNAWLFMSCNFGIHEYRQSMTRLTEGTETLHGSGIDWSEGAVAMRSGEEHLKRRKARYLKRKEIGAVQSFIYKIMHGEPVVAFAKSMQSSHFLGGRLARRKNVIYFFQRKPLGPKVCSTILVSLAGER